MKTRRGKIYAIREDLRPLLVKAKKLFPVMLGHVQTKRIFLCSVTARRLKHIARIGGVKKPFHLLIPEYDYFIEFWGNRFDNVKESLKIYVIVHELYHIPTTGFIVGAPGYRKCKHHDIEEFTELVKLYGISLENVDDVMKGEKVFLEKFKASKKIHRFPREYKVG